MPSPAGEGGPLVVDEELVCVKNYSSVTRKARATFPDKGRLLEIPSAPLFGFSSGEQRSQSELSKFAFGKHWLPDEEITV